ncbi:unnamed protein product [Symbiodinium microadriaticum]|nr:unnamed protein product [Symbiodinium sp. KB8]CAE7530629.1 unnamed protein product [Symbiodinium microadriaticum]
MKKTQAKLHDEALLKAETAPKEARVVVDCSGFGFENLKHLHILRHIVHVIERHFPEVSRSVTVVRAPWSVVSLYNIAARMGSQ